MSRIKHLLLLFVVFLLGTNAFSQILPGITPEKDSLAFARVQARMDSIRQYRPTVGLVLAGGGACGLAHLGVIKYMEELGIPVDIVTGTSMGGLVAGLYSLGYKQSQLDSLVRAINWPVMMSDDIPDNYVGYRLRKYRERFVIRIPWKYDQADAEYLIRRRQKQAETLFGESVPVSMGVGVPDGYLFGLNIRNLLSSFSVGYQDSISFADLPIPFACVATDMYSTKPKYWTGGSITSAMRSTMAIPLLFRPVRENGEILLDGGMINNFPADIAKAMGADIIIGSEMSTYRELEELNSPVDLLMQTITLMSSVTFEPAGKLLDVRMHHDLDDYNLLSFDAESIDAIIREGYQCAQKYKEPLESIATVVGGKESPSVHKNVPAVNLAQKKVHVKDVRFTGIAEDEKDRILQRSDYPKDGMYDRDVVEKMLNKIYGTNAFEAVSYHMEGSSEPYSLVFDCQKGQVNDFAIGIRADTDEYVAALLHLGLGTRRLSGPRLTADVKLGTNPSLTLDGSIQSGAGLPTVGITLRNRLINTLSGDLSDIDERLFTMAADIYLSDSRIRFGEMKAGLTAEMDPYEHFLSEGEMWQGYDLESYWLSAFVNLKYDDFDDGYFPTRGLRLSLKARQAFKGYSIDLDPAYSHTAGYTVTDGGSVPAYLSAMASAEAALSIGQNFTILPKLYAGWYSKHRDYLNPKHIVYMGGFMQDRYAERQIPFFGFQSGCRECLPFSASAQLDLRYRFGRKDFISVRGGIFGDDYTLQDLIHSAPVFAYGIEYSRQSIVGPLKVAFQHCNISGFTAHASIGFDF